MVDFLDVSDTSPVVSYVVGAGPQTVFAVPFAFFADSDLSVTVNSVPKTLSTDYTVAGALSPAGGTVTFAAAQSNVTVVIARNVPVSLSTHIPPSGPLDVPGINIQFSRLVAMLQEERTRFITLAALSSTSPTSTTIGTGSKTFTTQAGKAYVPGQAITVASIANPANFMAGQVTAYNLATGALTVNVTATGGAGTFADWLISISSMGPLFGQPSTTMIFVKDFGAVEDGVADDAPAIQAAINAAESLNGGIISFGRLHRINTGLRVRKSSVQLIGYGRMGIHFNAPIPTDRRTRVVWGGSAGATMLTIEPDGGAGTKHIDNNRAVGLSLHGQGVAAIGCQIRSTVAGEFDLYAEECTTTDFEIGVVPTLGDVRDTQYNRFNLASRNLNPGGGRNLRVGNDAGVVGNVSLNIFESVDCTFSSAAGVEIHNADNNSWMQIRVSRSSGVGNAIEIHGSNNAGENCREEYFNRVSTNAPIKIFGTPSYTFAATNIIIDNLDKGNATPDPLVEAGAFVSWRTNQGSIVLQLSGGAINLPNNGLRVVDTDGSHFLSIRPGSNLTANRDFTLVTGDAARTVTLSGNPTLADWFDQSVKQAASPLFVSVSLSGGQVAFPASQNPSADPNTLDDYEEGTWTPVLTFATVGNLTVVYSTQTGQYTKIGNLVTAWYSIATSTFTFTTSTGNCQITGLPFTPSQNHRSGAVRWQGITKASYTDLVGQAVSGATRIEFNISGSAQNTTSLATGDMPTAGTVILAGSVSFQV